jgi:hypothetical protein
LPDPAESMGELGSTGDGDIPDPPMLFARAIAVLDPLPRVDQRGAELLVAEWGTDMRRFRTARVEHGADPVQMCNPWLRL